MAHTVYTYHVIHDYTGAGWEEQAMDVHHHPEYVA